MIYNNTIMYMYLSPEKVRAASDRVVVEVFCCLLTAVVLTGVSPNQVTHRPKRRGLFEPV